jgi:isopenicillin-N N-acyltransferase-like protein
MRRFSLLFVMVLVIVACAAAQADVVATHGKGWLESQQGLLILHVEGTPAEMGEQHGALLKDHVQANLKNVMAGAMEMGKEMGIADPLPVLDMLWAQMAANTPQDYLDEMKALAAGAGIELKDLQRMVAVTEAGEIMRTCSSFCVWGKATADGKMYQSRNLDYTMDAGLQDNCMLLVAKPQGKFAFAAPSYAGLVGVVSGMNEKGIAVGEIGAGATEAERNFNGTPMPFLLRTVLETCDTAVKAAAVFENAKRTAGYNFVFGDPGNNTARACETSSQYFAVYKDNDPNEKAIPGNLAAPDCVFRAEGICDQKRIAETKHDTVAQCHRYQVMGKGIKDNYGKIDSAIAIKIAQAAAMDGNLHSVIYCNTDRELWVANAVGMTRASETEYKHFRMADLLAAKPA